MKIYMKLRALLTRIVAPAPSRPTFKRVNVATWNANGTLRIAASDDNAGIEPAGQGRQ